MQCRKTVFEKEKCQRGILQIDSVLGFVYFYRIPALAPAPSKNAWLRLQLLGCQFYKFLLLAPAPSKKAWLPASGRLF